MNDLRNKIVVVVGVSRGLGQRTAALLKEEGARVIGIGNQPPPPVQPPAICFYPDYKRTPALDAFFQADLASTEEIDAAVAALTRQFGDIDILVNNAGTLALDPLDAGVTSDVRRMLDVNLFGAWHLTSRLLPGLLRKGGRVVNVSSLFALVNAPQGAAYAISKRALVAYSDALRASTRGRISVSTVFPVFIDTAIHAPAERAGLSVKRLVTFKAGPNPLFTLEEPLDIAAGGLVAACQSGWARDRGVTPMGTLLMHLARWFPSLVEAVMRWRFDALLRSGEVGLQVGPGA